MRGFPQPVAKAVAAKAGQPHQIDILRIGAVLKVGNQPAEGGSGGGVINLGHGNVPTSFVGAAG
jgi:hypothetical protein